MSKSRRVLMLVHPAYLPSKGRTAAATEFDVWKALRRLGHTVEIAAAEFDLRRFDRALAEFKPDAVFNLLEEFRGEGVYDFHIVTYLESLGIPFTGCNPRGLIVTRNKLWTAHIARGEGLLAPASKLARPQARVSHYPALIKYNREHASLGMTRANVVHDRRELRRSVSRLRDRFAGEVIVQEFIAGLEVSVGVWGNDKIEALAPWRLRLPKPDDIATATVKFDAGYRRRKGIRATRLGAEGGLSKRLQEEAKRLYALFDMNGYARLDFRVNKEKMPFLIDVNANPCLAKTEDFARAAKAAGFDYTDSVARILQLGLDYQPRQ